jgi:hypothetical protein
MTWPRSNVLGGVLRADTTLYGDEWSGGKCGMPKEELPLLKDIQTEDVCEGDDVQLF